jgi:hypothetical protein
MSSTIIVQVPQGNTVTRTWTAFQGTSAFDLSDYNIQMTLKASDTSDDESGVQLDGTVVDAANGILSVEIPGTEILTPGTMWYRVDALTTIGDYETTLAQGPFIINPV